MHLHLQTMDGKKLKPNHIVEQQA